MKKKKFVATMGLFGFLLATGCTPINPPSDPTPQQEIYELAKESGFEGTYEEWLETVKGASLLNGSNDPTSAHGRDGDSYINTVSWDFFTKENGTWTKKGNIMGAQGAPGEPGLNGENGSPGAPGTNGEDGRSIVSIELSSTSADGLYDTYVITYSYGEPSTFVIKNGTPGEDGKDGSTGPQGVPGKDGITPTISIDPTTNNWIINGSDSGICALGKDGQQGTNGANGANGADGKSAFEIYKSYFSYSGTEEEWLNDLVNGNLGNIETHTVNFVSKYDITINSIQVPHGENITVDDITLPEGFSFKYATGGAYILPSNETWHIDNNLINYEPWSLMGNGVYQDMTLILDIYDGTLNDMSDESIINYYGRNSISSSGAKLYNTNSGFEVRFKGTQIKAKFARESTGSYGDGTIHAPTTMKVRVYIDGDMSIENSNVITLDSSTDDKLVTLASGLSDGEHTVLVRKVNYEERGVLVLKQLAGTRSFLDAPEKPTKKFLFYGDSITVGYGVNYNASQTAEAGQVIDTPEAEDGTKTWATLLTDYYGAQAQTMAVTGVSIGVPSWRQKTIYPVTYTKMSYFTGNDYDDTSYVPDVVFINLGTNDAAGIATGSTYGNGSSYQPSEAYTFWNVYAGYFNMINELKSSYYPNAKFVICYGMMGADESIATVLENDLFNNLEKTHSDIREKLFFLKMNQVECSTIAGHPTYAGQQNGFEQVKTFIKTNSII